MQQSYLSGRGAHRRTDTTGALLLVRRCRTSAFVQILAARFAVSSQAVCMCSRLAFAVCFCRLARARALLHSLCVVLLVGAAAASALLSSDNATRSRSCTATAQNPQKSTHRGPAHLNLLLLLGWRWRVVIVVPRGAPTARSSRRVACSQHLI